MLFAHLHGTESRIPLPPLTFPGDGLHIFHHGIPQGHDTFQMRHDAGFGFPATACRGWNTLLATQTIIKPFGASPFAKSASTAPGSTRLHCLLDVTGGLHHEVRHGITGPNDTEALELRAWIDAHHQGLIVRFAAIAQLDVEQAQFVPLGTSESRLEEMACLGGRTGHECDPACIDNWYSQGISLLQVLALGDMTLPDGPTGLGIVAIDTVSFGVARSGPN